jgi:protein ImuB
VARTACVDLPDFPLQLLLRRHPEWGNEPAGVVDRDHPQGTLLWVNEPARRRRVLPGMRYAAALSLCGALRAAVVPRGEIEREIATLGGRLRGFTPNVEPAREEPGTFWLDAAGLERLYESLYRWANLVHVDLRESGLRAAVVVGFDRFRAYAVARARRGVVVLRDPDEERSAARDVPLERIGIDPRSRDLLNRLGVVTLGEFAALPPDGIERRFGSAVQRLHRLATGRLHLPLQPEHPEPPALQRLELERPEADVPRLLVALERLIHPLVETVASRAQAVSEIRVGFRFERLGDHLESLRPAAPTLDARLLLELIRLRLEALRRLPDAVVELVLVASSVPAPRQQLELETQRPRRDRAAAERGLARVRADLGQDAIVNARLREGHLPEASFTWERFEELAAARPRDAAAGRMIRRIYIRPVPLPARPRHEPDGWMLHGLEQGPVVRALGPYVVSGGWWRHLVHREYHFAETQKGELLWVYYDRPRRRWFMHGRIE